jgi:hypothetical protein
MSKNRTTPMGGCRGGTRRNITGIQRELPRTAILTCNSHPERIISRTLGDLFLLSKTRTQTLVRPDCVDTHGRHTALVVHGMPRRKRALVGIENFERHKKTLHNHLSPLSIIRRILLVQVLLLNRRCEPSYFALYSVFPNFPMEIASTPFDLDVNNSLQDAIHLFYHDRKLQMTNGQEEEVNEIPRVCVNKIWCLALSPLLLWSYQQHTSKDEDSRGIDISSLQLHRGSTRARTHHAGEIPRSLILGVDQRCFQLESFASSTFIRLSTQCGISN